SNELSDADGPATSTTQGGSDAPRRSPRGPSDLQRPSLQRTSSAEPNVATTDTSSPARRGPVGARKHSEGNQAANSDRNCPALASLPCAARAGKGRVVQAVCRPPARHHPDGLGAGGVSVTSRMAARAKGSEEGQDTLARPAIPRVGSAHVLRVAPERCSGVAGAGGRVAHRARRSRSSPLD